MTLERLYYCSIENYEKSFEDIPCKILVLGLLARFNLLNLIKTILIQILTKR